MQGKAATDEMFAQKCKAYMKGVEKLRNEREVAINLALKNAKARVRKSALTFYSFSSSSQKVTGEETLVMFNAAFAATHSFKPIEEEYTARTSSFMVEGTSEEIMSMIYTAAITMSGDI